MDTQAVNQMITSMHSAGATLIECIKAVSMQPGYTLARAKTAVTAHPAWEQFAKAHEPFHDEVINIINHTKASRE